MYTSHTVHGFFITICAPNPPPCRTQCKRKIAAAINISSRNNHTGDNIVQSVKPQEFVTSWLERKQTRGTFAYTHAQKRNSFFDANPISENHRDPIMRKNFAATPFTSQMMNK